MQVPSRPAPSRRHPRSSTVQTTLHPAQIPHEGVGSSRPHPLIPATPRSQSPAHAGNPRQSPLNQQAPRPACHAGGRGFESRRSRKSTCKSASFVAARPPAFLAFRVDPARESAGNPRREPVVAANPRKRTTGPAGRRSVDERSRSGVCAGVSSSQATGRNGMPHGSRVVVLVPSIDLGNYRFLPPAAGPAAVPSVLERES